MSEFNKISKRAVAKEKYRKNMTRKSEKKRRKKEVIQLWVTTAIKYYKREELRAENCG